MSDVYDDLIIINLYTHICIDFFFILFAHFTGIKAMYFCKLYQVFIHLGTSAGQAGGFSPQYFEQISDLSNPR